MVEQDGAKDPGAGGEHQLMTGALIQAVNHPLRRRLLRALHGADDARSPTQLSKIVGEEVSKIDYHFKTLARHGAIQKTGERQVRGTREHFFASKVLGHKQVLGILADTEKEDDASRR